MSLNQVAVAGIARQPDGSNPTALGGPYGETACSDVNPTYFMASYRGRTFSAQASITVLAAASTAQTFFLWNPTGSQTVAIPLRARMTMTTTPTTAGGIGLAYATNWGSSIATGGVSATTPITPVNMAIGSPNATQSRMNVGSAATIVSGQEPTNLMPLFGLTDTAISATTANSYYTFDTEFRGSLQVWPGTTITVVTFTEAVGVGNFYLEWYEIPAA